MDLSPIGRAALRAREGERLTAYRDTKGTLTISVGITEASGLIKLKPGTTITASQSDALFAKAVEAYVAPVRESIHFSVPQPFFDACVSLCYNIGPSRFQNSSVAMHANAGDLKAAADAFLLFNRPAEVLSRRQGERDQATLKDYETGKVYARRGDRVAVAVPQASPAAKPSLWARLHAALTRRAA